MATHSESTALVYSLLSGSEGGEFKVDSISGAVHTGRPLDREALVSVRSSPRPASVYLLVVCAHVTRESPSVIGCCVNVTVDVIDVNDNTPTVLQVISASKIFLG